MSWLKDKDGKHWGAGNNLNLVHFINTTALYCFFNIVTINMITVNHNYKSYY